MGPQLICDKSTFESLGPKPFGSLRRYYSLVVPPVLLTEILADLAKEFKNSTSKEYVVNLANRIPPLGSAVCLSFRDLIDQELGGHPLDLRGVPVLDGAVSVVSSDGKAGIRIDPSPEEKTLERWQAGDFTIADEMTAKIWRTYLKGIDLAEAQHRLQSRYPGLPTLRQLPDSAKIADELLALEKREDSLNYFLEDSGAPAEVRERFARNLATLPAGNLSKVAPFTYHCVRTTLIFHLALMNNLVGSRATNRIDLEYLFYAQLGNAFSSKDKFLIAMARVVLTDTQTFIPGEVLRSDLVSLAAMWEGFSPEQEAEEKHIYGPPENPSSVTHQVWQKYMKPGYRQRRRPKLTPELSKRLMELVTPLMKARESGKPVTGAAAQKVDFMYRTRTVRLNSPCSCGSNKTIAECCWPRTGSS